MGDKFETIGYRAFCNCSGLTSLQVGAGVTSIYNDENNDYSNPFYGTNLLKVVWLTNTPPENYRLATGKVNYVANNQYSFRDDVSVVEYPFLSSIFEVGGVRYVPVNPSERTCDAIDYAYDGTEEISMGPIITNKGVSLTLRKVMPWSFYGNNFIKDVEVDFDGDLPDNEFFNCQNLKNVVIGDRVKSIGNWAFSGCAKLDYLAFGTSVKEFGDEAFSDCVSITKIVSRAAPPPKCGAQALDDINKWNCTLYVPKGYGPSYRAADQWKEFFFVEETDFIPAKPQMGDIDSNGEINTTDVTALYNVIFGTDTTTDPTICDIDGNGEINTTDVTALYNIIFGTAK
ncbi:MAG: leucine-rich repeat protein [Prevotella sp.]|nr:leucine-rich repeat protein [Prevotella sp.]